MGRKAGSLNEPGEMGNIPHNVAEIVIGDQDRLRAKGPFTGSI
jgi:hypothetical protein